MLRWKAVMAVVALASAADAAVLCQKKSGAVVVRELPFADHHRFTGPDLDRIAGAAREARAAILTTEKDLARLGAEGAHRLPGLRAIRMEMVVLEEDALERLILEATA